MSKIEIREVDLTTIEQTATTTNDIVYIPGFSSLVDSELAAPVNEPVLCNSVAEFVNSFGDSPPIFSSNQNYPDGMFPTEAIPSVGMSSNVMFQRGTPDPSYVYARELLALGVPVVYERVNEDPEDDVTVDNMYTFLSTNFKYQKDLSCTASTGLTVDFIATTGKASFMSVFKDFGRYRFTNVGKSTINIDYGDTKTSDKLIVDVDSALASVQSVGTHTYKVTVNGSTVTWKEGATTVNLSELGITYLVSSGETLATNDQIVVKVLDPGWADSKGKIYDLAHIGIEITDGSPQEDSNIVVVYTALEPKLIDKNLYSIKRPR